MTTRVNTVEASRPNIRVQASPEKMGSRVMGQAPRAVVAAVSRMGRMRMHRLDGLHMQSRCQPRERGREGK